jgi:8-oxo-dGTP pyrophosphatase MutT (NUDIX family)
MRGMMRDATLCFLLQEGPPRQVLLGYKKVGFGAAKYNGFGGKVQAGETIAMAAIREMAEEAGVRVLERDLTQVAHLTFVFPEEPDWNQVVHAFLSTVWEGEPAESREMSPSWFPVEDIPFDRMWQDDAHWLSRVLAGERLRGHFTFKGDNETIHELELEPWDGVDGG